MIGNNYIDIIYLLKCALSGKNPNADRASLMDNEAIKKISKKHKISGLVAKSLESVDNTGYWVKIKNSCIKRTILFDAERKKLYKFMDDNKIWYLPLKGIIITNYYPEYGIREFTDNDILFDKKYAEMIRDYFVSQNYEVKMFNKENHDVYHKEPIYNFEMHTSLFNEISGKVQNEYYKNIFDKVIKREGKYEVSLNDNDFYVYFMAHAVKHYSRNGTGLRTLVDIYILLKKLNLDWQYVKCELDKMDLLDKANELKELAIALFDGLPLTEEQELLFDKICQMGVYGTYKTRIDNELSKKNKQSYLMERLFMPIESIKLAYPVVYRHKILLPGFYAW